MRKPAATAAVPRPRRRASTPPAITIDDADYRVCAKRMNEPAISFERLLAEEGYALAPRGPQKRQKRA